MFFLRYAMKASAFGTLSEMLDVRFTALFF